LLPFRDRFCSCVISSFTDLLHNKKRVESVDLRFVEPVIKTFMSIETKKK